ncbi:MAG: hypothetical protein KatS3mg087_2108 [Patescibacteria group bacterium]|nr:MAG: hypothetical protein KatS3mg087_2108 [Patescibacteria group bacterium]
MTSRYTDEWRNDWDSDDERKMQDLLRKYRTLQVQSLLSLGVEMDEIEQEMRIWLWRAKRRYDPAMSGYDTWLAVQCSYGLSEIKRKYLKGRL